ncbi:hypothetical protein F4815DRAFT_445015 [Daldinia loculata]|nr:hypothetical protein F4815DRAFT_445015 [Daldinia loculata]
MPLAPKTNPHGEDLICRCGARALYLFLALLDETGEPKLDTGIRRAICSYYSCGFHVDWEHRAQVEEISQGNWRSPPIQLPRSDFMQQGEFNNISVVGNNNRIGNWLHIDHLTINPRELQAYSTGALDPPYSPFNAETLRRNSSDVHLQGGQVPLIQLILEYFRNFWR